MHAILLKIDLISMISSILKSGSVLIEGLTQYHYLVHQIFQDFGTNTLTDYTG